MGSEWHWQGASGAWYRHLIWDIPESLASMPANYILVRRSADGTRRALYIAETEDLARSWRDHRASGLLERALDLGAAEIHFHCAGRDDAERALIATDLRRAQAAPLNRPRTQGFNGFERFFPAPGLEAPGSLHDDPIVELANVLNARSAATGRQTPLWAAMA
jgi:hypothetical protein